MKKLSQGDLFRVWKLDTGCKTGFKMQDFGLSERGREAQWKLSPWEADVKLVEISKKNNHLLSPEIDPRAYKRLEGIYSLNSVRAVRRPTFSSCCAPALCHRAVICGGLLQMSQEMSKYSHLSCSAGRVKTGPLVKGIHFPTVVSCWPWYICSLWSPVGITQPSSGLQKLLPGLWISFLPPPQIPTLEHRVPGHRKLQQASKSGNTHPYQVWWLNWSEGLNW